MGKRIEMTDTGVEVHVHLFDDKASAEHYMRVGRGYKFDRHEPWAFSEGFDFYSGPQTFERGCIRKSAGSWKAVFWSAR